MTTVKEKLMRSIIFYRDARRLNNTQIASACDVSQPTVTNWFKGRNSMTLENLIALCKLLSTDPNTLLGWED